MGARHWALVCGALLVLRSVSGFYLPGVAPQDYVKVQAFHEGTVFQAMVGLELSSKDYGAGGQGGSQSQQAHFNQNTTSI